MDWKDRPALVIGGAPFIGAHLVEQLLALGARIRVVDSLNSGRLEYLKPHIDEGTVEFLQSDLLDQATSRTAVAGMDVVFDLPGDADGPMNRVADNSLTGRLPGWEPEVSFVEDLYRTIDWYFSTKHPDEVVRHPEQALTER